MIERRAGSRGESSPLGPDPKTVTNEGFRSPYQDEADDNFLGMPKN
jgi:hypothetical protein